MRRPGNAVPFAVQRGATLAGLARNRIVRDSQSGPVGGHVVALTTYPARAKLVHRTLRSVVHQSVRAAQVFLVLSERQFPGRRVPEGVAHFAARGLVELLWDSGDIRSYKKLIPVRRACPGATIITADDDVLYPRRWAEFLLQAHTEHPTSVVCQRGLRVERLPSGAFSPYRTWRRARPSDDSVAVLPIGVGGVLYPADSLDDRVDDMTAAMALSPHADDLWFKTMSLLRGTSVEVLPSRRDVPANALRDAGTSLSSSNVNEGGNDTQLLALSRAFPNAWSLVR